MFLYSAINTSRQWIKCKIYKAAKRIIQIHLTLAVLLLCWLLSACKNNETIAIEKSPPFTPTQKVQIKPDYPKKDTAPDAKKELESPQTEKEIFIKSKIEQMNLKEKIGQLFILSFETDENGTPLTVINNTIIEKLRNYNPGGIVYFASNIDTPEQTLKLSNDFKANCKIPPFISVDEEGGRVTRITKSAKMGVKNSPPAKIIGNTNDSENAYTVYKLIAEELVKLGINTCFAPVCDLNSDNQGVIGDRAFGDVPDKVGEFAARAVDAFNDAKVMSAIKHFPGHGAAIGDTHTDSIVSDKSAQELIETDIVPFRVAAGRNPAMIMLSHITTKNWNIPASMSKDAVLYIRNEMGFNGVIITDSFRMGAITNLFSADIAAKHAVAAGIDIILMPENIEKAIEGITTALENGEINESRIDESVFRILSVKYDYGLFEETQN